MIFNIIFYVFILQQNNITIFQCATFETNTKTGFFLRKRYNDYYSARLPPFFPIVTVPIRKEKYMVSGICHVRSSILLLFYCRIPPLPIGISLSERFFEFHRMNLNCNLIPFSVQTAVPSCKVCKKIVALNLNHSKETNVLLSATYHVNISVCILYFFKQSIPRYNQALKRIQHGG